MPFEEAPIREEEGRDRSHKNEVLDLAVGVAHVALEANEKMTRLRSLLRAGTLTAVDISEVGNEIERYVYREICDLVKVDEDTRRRALRER